MTKIVNVAAAIIIHADGAFLLGQRAPGTFYPGYWEFPGGKVEPGETAREALVRELQEELDIRVTRLTPWITRRHVYEHAHVCLHFFRVTGWEGELRDHVHSALSWQSDPTQLTVEPMLPANGPILKALALPDFYAITQAGQLGVPAQLQRLETALARGLRLIQVREAEMDRETLGSFTRAVVALAHAHGAQVLVNGDEALARESGADGIHLPARRLLSLKSRPDLPLVAASCHNRQDLEQAADLELDFAVLGAVKPTLSHPGQAALGWEAFGRLVDDLPMPVFALGGLNRDDQEEALLAGAQGIAAIRGAWIC